MRLAIADIRAKYAAEHGEKLSQAQQAEWFGVKQQTISAFNANPAVGEKLADGVARHLKTTVDGLVRQYLHQEVGEVRVCDLQGWDEAVAKAKEDAGPAGADFPWAAAAHVTLPVAPARATPEFAYTIAHLLHRFGRSSGFLRRAK